MRASGSSPQARPAGPRGRAEPRCRASGRRRRCCGTRSTGSRATTAGPRPPGRPAPGPRPTARRAPPPRPFPILETLLALVAGIVLTVLLSLFLVVRHRRRNPAPQSQVVTRVAPPTCPACGHVEVPDGIYCSRCGTTLQTSALRGAAPASSREPPPSGGIV